MKPTTASLPAVPSVGNLPTPPPGRTGWPWTGPTVEPASSSLANAAPLPPITVVTPSYNQGRYLEETIRSVLLQGYPQLEYIIMDGGSTDESVAIIRKYAPWLDYWVSEADHGQSHAINKGFVRAQGEVLGWLNSDDIYLPGALAAVGASLGPQPDVALIYGRAHYMDQESVLAGEVLALPFNYQTLLTESNFIPQPSAFFRRGAYLAAGGLDAELHFCMDYDLWLKLYAQGRAIFMPQPLSGMRTYPQSKTGSADRRLFVEVRQMIGRHGGPALPFGFARWLLATRVPKAFEAFRLGNVDAGRDELDFIVQNVPAWQSNPESIVTEIVRYSWRQAPGLTDDDQPVLDYADLVCNHLPGRLATQKSMRRQTFSRLERLLAARTYQLGHFPAARRYVRRAFHHSPRLLGNRQLWGILVRSAIQPKVQLSRPKDRLVGPELRRRVLASLALESPTPVVAPTPAPLLDTCGVGAIIGLLDGWDVIEPSARSRWIAELRAAQDTTTGLFVDSRQFGAHRYVSAPGHAGDGLTSYLALNALAMLGADPGKLLILNDAFKSPDAVREWLMRLDWVSPDSTTSLDWSHPWLSNSAQVMFLVSFLLWEGSRTQEPAYPAAAHAIFDWLDDRQDPNSGFWLMSRGKHRIVHTILAGHFAPLYLSCDRPLNHLERLIDTTIALQMFNGLFPSNGVPSLCATQAAVELLVKIGRLTDYRADTIKVALTHVVPAVSRALEASSQALNASPRVPPTSSQLAEPAHHWLRHSQLAAHWLGLVTLGLISQRYPDEFLPGVPWHLPKPPALGWYWSDLHPTMRAGR